MTARIYILRLEGRSGAETAHVRTLRFLLKYLLKHRGLVCTDAREESAENFTPSQAQAVEGTPSAPKRSPQMVDMSKYAGGQFLKVADVKEGGPFKVAIVNVVVGEKFGKPQAELSDGSILTLNATNVGRLIRHYGAESDDWRDKEVELDVDDYVDGNGETKEMIVLKPISPPLSAKEKVPVTPQKKRGGNARDDLNDSIPF